MPRFKRIVSDNGFVLWDGGSKKECDEFWASGAGGPPISSPSLSLSTKEMRSKKGPNGTPASSPTLSSSTKSLRSKKREDPRGEGDTGLAGLLDSD
jgi:hypothetical protein